MALRATTIRSWRWSPKLSIITTTIGSSGQKKCLASATAPKLSPPSNSSSPASNSAPYNKYSLTGEYAPVYIVMGFVSVAVAIGVHTAKQQLVHSPGVSLRKTRRGSMSEADRPDLATTNGQNFLNKSFLRKVGHIQQQDKN
ncbi:unnamed protein product [Linum trigynum]|uniref:Uncharacterized protein n=1 Tax=Linum trigynum TaxID=586398 RepID=A0AAV2CFS6_9ROSI